MQAAQSLPLNPQWFAAPGRSTCAMGAAAALVVGTAVVGTAHAAHEPAELQRTTVVSELPAKEETESDEPSDGEAASDGQGSTTPVAAPPEPVPEEVPASVPLDELRVTSPFGWRENPLLAAGTLEFHTGIDFGAVTGTPVKAAAAGTVTYAEYHQYGGLRIVVDHGNGTETTYNHLNEIHVEVGQWVDFNTVIGAIGSTGNSTGPHLHFEVLANGEYQDPAVWLGI
ncbi:M23 family metallopeptidase [Arthrobacter sp. G119Y2]|uniref:M23 family metallopeptidase n=1 Tax=Arthrobacter sp. G119Y2 TaxID=3134965 RepID=UPI00311A8A7C